MRHAYFIRVVAYCVRNHNVDATELLDCFVYHAAALRGGAHILRRSACLLGGCIRNSQSHASEHDGLDAMLLASRSHFLCGFKPIEIVDGDVCAFFCERRADDLPQAAGQ